MIHNTLLKVSGCSFFCSDAASEQDFVNVVTELLFSLSVAATPDKLQRVCIKLILTHCSYPLHLSQSLEWIIQTALFTFILVMFKGELTPDIDAVNE